MKHPRTLAVLLLALTGCIAGSDPVHEPEDTESTQDEAPSTETPGSHVVPREGQGDPTECENDDPTGCPAPEDECHAVVCEKSRCVQAPIGGCSITGT